MSRFRVGEIALAQRWDMTWHECTIVALPGCRTACCAGREIPPEAYIIDVPTERHPDYRCGHFGALEHKLRKRPQPGIPESVLEVFRVPARKGETV